MLREWTDKLPESEADSIWRTQIQSQTTKRLRWIEEELRVAIADRNLAQLGFYEAMRHFLNLRQKLFPGLPADPAWKMLVTLAQTPPDSDLACVTSIAFGAEVPLSTALRYIAVMEMNGIVERMPHPDDARRTMIRLTPEGQRRLDQIADKWMTKLALLVVLPLVGVSAIWHLA